jgi:hypothetical protein
MSVRSVRSRRSASVDLVDPERLFAGLDGRAVTVAGDDWRVNVFGVLDQAGRRWVQVALNGSKYYMLTLCLAPGDGVPQALLALSNWLHKPTTGALVRSLNAG